MSGALRVAYARSPEWSVMILAMIPKYPSFVTLVRFCNSEDLEAGILKSAETLNGLVAGTVKQTIFAKELDHASELRRGDTPRRIFRDPRLPKKSKRSTICFACIRD